MSDENNQPPMKKIKIKETTTITKIEMYIRETLDQTVNLKPVLSDDFFSPLPLTPVYVGHVKNPKDMSRIIQTFNNKIPLKELQHLKRARKKEVLVCPVSYVSEASSIQELLKFQVPELSDDTFEYFRVIDVPAIAPKIKSQVNNLKWSCNFHPNKLYETLASNNYFTSKQLKPHINYMKIAFETIKYYLTSMESDLLHNDFYLTKSNINTAVVVDPIIDSIVAISFCNNDHPLKHAAMLAIDHIAVTQRGGVWNSQTTGDCIWAGVDNNLKSHLRRNYPDIKFGARQYYSKRDPADLNDAVQTDTKDSPYLCTGYEVYMMREPCVMCAMALVHARMKRVFFCFDNQKHGALKSRVKLQTIALLNHHFEVFTGFNT